MKRYRSRYKSISRKSPRIKPLKGFFKSGENYVGHLSAKSKILSRILEIGAPKKVK